MEKSVGWRQYFPYSEPREIQSQALDVLFSNWDSYDVFVINAPTAFGKTGVAKTMQNAFRSVSVIAPTNQLVEQFRTEFPETCSLGRLDGYQCAEWKRPCSVTRGKLRKFCSGCPASGDLARAKYRNGPGIYNYHIYTSHKLYRDVLVVDEAHNLIPHITDRMAVQLWRHDYNYPHNAWTNEALLQWAQGLSEKKRRTKKIELLIDCLTAPKPTHVIQRTKDWYNGKGTLRGDPEEREVLKLLPVDIRHAPALFWPREVKKIVLLSATISRKDVERLGLSRRRVAYIDCASPIPGGNRPILLHDVASVNRANMHESIPLIVAHIRQLAEYHKGEKGLIHMPYQMAVLVQHHLTESRFLFHSNLNKKEQYERFRASSPESGTVLVASGMYEGVDLPYDAARWQCIAKVPWGSLGNPAVKYIADTDPEGYTWDTLRTVIQACGRVCRTPEDYGCTYILDSTIRRLLDNSFAAKLVPHWFDDAIVDS